MAAITPPAAAANIPEASIHLYQKAQQKGFPYYLIAKETDKNGTTKLYDGISYHFYKGNHPPTVSSVNFYAMNCFDLLASPRGFAKKLIVARDLKAAVFLEQLPFYKKNSLKFLFAALQYVAPEDLSNEVGKCQVIIANNCMKKDWNEAAKWLLSALERITEKPFKEKIEESLHEMTRAMDWKESPSPKK